MSGIEASGDEELLQQTIHYLDLMMQAALPLDKNGIIYHYWKHPAGDSVIGLGSDGDIDGAVLGGVLAKVGRGWLHINTLWVDPSVRGQGYGTQLMAMVEAEALRRGCHSAYLDTFSFQARPFYEHCTYEVFGTLEDFPAGHQRFFMRKALR